MKQVKMKDKYASKPNLLRVAAGLARCKDPDRALAVVQLALKGGVDDIANSQKDISLSVS